MIITCCDCGDRKQRTKFEKSKTDRCHDCDLARRRSMWAKRYQTTRGRAKWMLMNAKARSKQRGLRFAIPLEWAVEKLEAGMCEGTGLPFVMDTDSANFKTGDWAHPMAPSIERKDPRGDYTPENCEMICWLLNRAKAKFDRETFDAVMRAYLNFQK